MQSHIAKSKILQQPSSRTKPALLLPGTWYGPPSMRLCGKMNVAISSNISNNQDVDWVFCFHQSEYESNFPHIDAQTLWNPCIEASGWMRSSTVCRFVIFEGMNCVMVLLFAQTVSSWLSFDAHKTNPETEESHGWNWSHTHTHTHTHIYICMCVCVCVCVWLQSSNFDMEIRVQILKQAVCITYSANSFGKRVNPTILLPVMGRLGPLILICQPI